MAEIQPIRWQDDHLELLDQRLLPHQQQWLAIHTCGQTAAAIRQMSVRGAPAIGVAAAYGMALAAREADGSAMEGFLGQLREAGAALSAARPTAVNLSWAVDRCLRVARRCTTPADVRTRLLDEAKRMHQADVAANQAMGRHGAALLHDAGRLIFLCPPC